MRVCVRVRVCGGASEGMGLRESALRMELLLLFIVVIFRLDSGKTVRGGRDSIGRERERKAAKGQQKREGREEERERER